MIIRHLILNFIDRFEGRDLEYSNDLQAIMNSDDLYSELNVLKLVKCLFFTRMNIAAKKERSWSYIALVLCCLNQTKIYVKVNEVSRRVAKLLYFMKISTLALVSSDLEFSESIEQEKSIEEFYLSFYQRTVNNPIISMLHFSKFVASFGTEQKLPKVYWVVNSNYTKLQAGPTTISIQDLRDMTRKGNELITNFFRDNLMMRFNFEVPSILSDDFNNAEEGYYFVHDHNNNFLDAQIAFHQHLCSKGVMNDIEAYVENWRKFMQLLIFNIHLTSGNPARATELETLQFKNSGLKERNVFVFQDKIALIPTYNKTNNLKGQDRLIPRFLPKNLSHIVIKYLIFVQPILEHYYRTISSRPITGLDESIFLFSVNNEMLNIDQIKNDFMKTLRMICLKEVKFSIFRHIVDAFGLRHIAQYKSDFEKYENFALQAGHSSLTASRIYGARSNDFRQVDRETCQRMYDTSASWHKFLNIDDSNDVEPIIEMFEQVRVTDNRQENLVKIQSQQESQVQTQIATHTDESRVFERNIIHLDNTEQQSLIEEPSNFMSLKILYSIRKMLKTDSAFFSCEEQAIVAIEVMKCENDVLAIIPTGSGKTMTILANVKLEKKVTIFIFPLVGIRNMMIKKCQEFEISCNEFSLERMSSQSKIVLVSIENSTDDVFIDYLSKLQSEGLLARIVIDEVHLCLQWNSFRPKYKYNQSFYSE